ncbi:hypothetical protein ACHAWF_017641 [Thalassiosira exigua]
MHRLAAAGARSSSRRLPPRYLVPPGEGSGGRRGRGGPSLDPLALRPSSSLAPPGRRRDEDERDAPPSFVARRRLGSHPALDVPLRGTHLRRSRPELRDVIHREYHATVPPERGVAIVLSLGAIAATAKAGQYAVQAYNEWDAQRKVEEEERKARGEEEEPAGAAEEGGKEQQQHQEAESASSGGPGASSGASSGSAGKEKRENIFASWFNVSVGSKYYEGGFEDQMTRKEAALILGVRESSAAKRIKEAHRKLLILNHPDTGGSTYISGKINEAKELLLKGRKA